jgi:CheY-like chemotaxis protein
VDPGKLKQVLYNFLSNAVKFTPEGGRITVRTRAEADSLFRLEVQDTGIGIKEADLPRLFVEFQQLDASAAKAYPGTGLGLALTRRIVEAQGGSVGVESTAGQGSRFFAVLPRVPAGSQAAPAPALAPLPRPAAAGSPSILVIEDDTDERRWLAETLRGAGYHVETASTGRDALRLCGTRSYDGITLDILLSDMSGWDVLRAIRGEGANRDTPIIIVTVVAERGLAAGVAIHDFLTKPVRAEDLMGSLERAGVRPAGQRPILVVDDQAQARKLMETTLLGFGYQSRGAASAEEGLRLCAAEPPAAVILDLLMPDMDGFEFLERFRRTSAGRGTPVIVWTAKDLTSDDQVRLAASAHAVVLKGEAGTRSLMEELHACVGPPAPATGAGAAHGG